MCGADENDKREVRMNTTGPKSNAGQTVNMTFTFSMYSMAKINLSTYKLQRFIIAIPLN